MKPLQQVWLASSDELALILKKKNAHLTSLNNADNCRKQCDFLTYCKRCLKMEGGGIIRRKQLGPEEGLCQLSILHLFKVGKFALYCLGKGQRATSVCVSTFSVEWRPATVLIWKGVSYLASAQYFTLRIGLVGQSIGQAGASQLYYLQLHVIFRKVSDPSYIKIT